MTRPMRFTAPVGAAHASQPIDRDKAPDGSYRALRAWQQALPDYGVAPDVMRQRAAPRPSDQAADATADTALTALGDKQCHAN